MSLGLFSQLLEHFYYCPVAVSNFDRKFFASAYYIFFIVMSNYYLLETDSFLVRQKESGPGEEGR